MKKILLIIFLFLCTTGVYAQERAFITGERLVGISYLKDDGSGVQYKDQYLILDEATHDIAYCTEPFELLKDKYYYEENEMDINMSYEDWDRIKLYSYYGYGYKNHLDKNWITITQMSIWRTLFPNYRFEWINNTHDRTIIYPFDIELEELNNLVDSHYIHPLIEEEYVVGINENYVIKDLNNVLNNYTIINSDFDAQIIDNKLIIKTDDEEKEGVIRIQRAGEIFRDTVKFYYNSKSQNLIKRGNIDPIEIEVKIIVRKGKISINKIDSYTKENESNNSIKLDGAVFELLNKDKEVIKELTIIDKTLEFDNLPFGKYYVKEKNPGIGYYLNQNMYEVIVDEEHLSNTITIENDPIISRVKITKLYGTEEEYEKGNMKAEPGITFRIYDDNNDLVFEAITCEDGYIEVPLLYGNYSLEQVNTSEGYSKNDIYYFSINEDNSTSYDIVLYDFKINVPNASISLFNYIISLLRECLYV